MSAPLDYRETETFKFSWAVASHGLGNGSRAFDEAVLAAVQEIFDERPGFGVPSETPEHTFPLTKGYELVYQWGTDFVQGVAVAHHLELLLIRKK